VFRKRLKLVSSGSHASEKLSTGDFFPDTVTILINGCFGDVKVYFEIRDNTVIQNFFRVSLTPCDTIERIVMAGTEARQTLPTGGISENREVNGISGGFSILQDLRGTGAEFVRFRRIAEKIPESQDTFRNPIIVGEQETGDRATRARSAGVHYFIKGYSYFIPYRPLAVVAGIKTGRIENAHEIAVGA
jgi:hypothetical protein